MKLGRSENRGSGGGAAAAAPSADQLLVCFPSRSRAHLISLTLMPKHPISSSPARQPSSTLNRHHRRSRSRASTSISNSQTRPTEIAAEPTSPKVTCAGQIKVITPKPKPKPKTTCKNWQSVMEEIERLHNRKQRKKYSTWAESLGFKKDAYQFFTCLRNLRFDFRCFGASGSSDHPTTTTTDDEEEDENDEKESSRTVFSKWFMVLQEEQNNNIIQIKEESGGGGGGPCPCAPPPNALLLMRCRSAPATNNWLQDQEVKKEKSNSLEVLMKFDADFYKLSSSSSSTKHHLLRSRTWKR